MRLFFRNRNEQVNTVIENQLSFHQACTNYIIYCVLRKTVPLQETYKEMAVVKNEIIKWMHSMLNSYKDKAQTEWMEYYQTAITWVNKNL